MKQAELNTNRKYINTKNAEILQLTYFPIFYLWDGAWKKWVSVQCCQNIFIIGYEAVGSLLYTNLFVWQAIFIVVWNNVWLFRNQLSWLCHHIHFHCFLRLNILKLVCLCFLLKAKLDIFLLRERFLLIMLNSI